MVIVFVAAGLCAGALVGAIFGWQYSIMGLGAALGPWIGGYFGNKKAREVDKYRDELIRAGSTRRSRMTRLSSSGDDIWPLYSFTWALQLQYLP